MIPLVIPPRFRRPLLYVGYVAFAMAVAVLTLYGALPRDRIKDRLETALSADPSLSQPLAIGMDVTIRDLSVTLFSGAGIKGYDVVLKSRPPNPGDKPARYFLDDVTVHLGLIGAMFNRPTYGFKGHGLSGSANGAVSLYPDETRFRIELEHIVLNGVQGIQQSVGLPLEGSVSGKLDVVAPKQLLANADGSAEINIDDCVVGDGKAKLIVPNDPFLSQGMTFPRIKLGKLSGKLVIEKGRARFDDIKLHSSDGDATLEGYIELRDPIGLSQMHGYLKFKPAAALSAREPTIELMLNALSGTAKRADGYLGFQITGLLSSMQFLPNKEPPPGVSSRPAPVELHPPPALPSATTPPPIAPNVAAPPPPTQPPPTSPEAEPPPPPLPPPPPPERSLGARPGGLHAPSEEPREGVPEGTPALPSNQKGE